MLQYNTKLMSANVIEPYFAETSSDDTEEMP